MTDARPLIAHVIHRLATGGMENGLVNLINNMDSRYRHAIVCLTEHTAFRDRIERDDVTLVALNKKPGKDLPHYGRLLAALRRLRPQLVHTRNIGTIEAGVVARIAGVPNVVHGEHGFDIDDLAGTNRRYQRLRRLCQPFIRRFVCVSQQISDWLRDGVGLPAAKLTQIYNGVDIARFAPAAREPARAQLRAAGVTAPFVVAVVGRLEVVKNPQAALRAFAALAARSDEFRAHATLAFIGDGSLGEDLRREVAAAGLVGRVHVLGRRDDVSDLLPGVDAFVLPSLNEGISNTILEAMACGVPVIASRVGGNPELVVDAQTGFLYPADDLDLLGTRLESYFRDAALRARHAEAARARVVEKFSLRRMTDAYERMYGQFCQ